MSADMTANAAGAAPAPASHERTLAWPGDAESVTAAGIDFEALAHVLANTCRFGGRTPRYHSLAGHALVASEEVAALDGLGDEDRRVLALHALVADAPSAWLGGQPGGTHRGGEPGSQTGPGRTGRLAAGIERAVREAAGLDPVLAEEHAELLRLIARMTAAAERRDLFEGEAGGPPADSGAAFPPLKRRIRPLGPGRAAKLWLARFRALARPPEGDGAGAGAGAEESGTGAGNDGKTNEREDGDVADVSAKKGPQTPTGTRARAPGGRHERKAA